MSRTSALGQYTSLPVLADGPPDITSIGTTFADQVEKKSMMRFASTAARDAAITVPEDGMWVVITGTHTVYRYDGTGWIIMGEPDQSYTPTWTNLTIGSPGQSNVGRFKRSDGYVDFYAKVVLGTGGAATGIISVSTPVAFGDTPRSSFGVLLHDASVNDQLGTHEATVAGATSFSIFGLTISGTISAVPVNTGAASPFTWTVSDYISISGRAKMNTPYL